MSAICTWDVGALVVLVALRALCALSLCVSGLLMRMRGVSGRMCVYVCVVYTPALGAQTRAVDAVDACAVREF